MTTEANLDAAKWLDNYGDSLYRYALFRVNSEAVAEDLVQDTLLAGLQALASFNRQSSIKTWLMGIMKHKVMDHFRQHCTDTEPFDDDDDALMSELFNKHGHWQGNVSAWKNPEKSVQDEQFWQIYRQCLERLPENMRTLFVLCSVDKLPIEHCCQVLNIPTTNLLYVTLSRTRVKLRHCLDTYWFME